MHCQSNQDNNEMVEFNYQSIKKEMAQAGLISALMCTNQAVFEENEVKTNRFVIYSTSVGGLLPGGCILFQHRDFCRISNSNMKTEITVQLQTQSEPLVRYGVHPVCRYQAFLWVPGEILSFYPATFTQKLVRNHWDGVVYTFHWSVSALLKE